jgi:hypothetical protein
MTTTEEATAKLRELNEQVLQSAKAADAVYLDTVERTMSALADFQAAAAQGNQDEQVRALATAYAQFTREVTNAYVSAVRSLRS